MTSANKTGMFKPASAVATAKATFKTKDSPNSSFSGSPDEPLLTIQPSRSWAPLNIRDIWVSRELLYFLVWRDLKVRYKQTVLGAAWAIMQPLLMTVIFTIFLGKLVRVPSDGVPYPLFAYTGLMAWTFFSGAVSSTGNSLVGNSHLITKVYFPRLIIPISSIAARLVDLGVAFVILIGLMFYFRVAIMPQLLMTPVFLLLLALLALSFGMWTSALNVKYRDVGHALPVLIQLWMFVSPVVYPLSLVPEQWRLVYSLNPMVGIIEGYRAALFGGVFNWRAISISVTVTFALLIYAAYSFRSRERDFADII